MSVVQNKDSQTGNKKKIKTKHTQRKRYILLYQVPQVIVHLVTS